MKKLLYLGFCLVLLAGLGCAITDYGIITDNNQTTGKAAQKRGAGVQPVIDTKGKAHIRETSQIATIWPDGTDELINFVDQRADGTATLTTFNNFSTGGEPTFHDDLYCNTDRVGCSVFTAPDNNDGNLFDGVFNENCSGARSLSLLLSTGRYYGECGNAGQFNVNEIGTIIQSAVQRNIGSMEGLWWGIDSTNTSVVATNSAGDLVNLPLRGSTGLWADVFSNRALFWMDNALLAHDLRTIREFMETSAGPSSVITITFNGVARTVHLSANNNIVLENLAHNLGRM